MYVFMYECNSNNVTLFNNFLSDVYFDKFNQMYILTSSPLIQFFLLYSLGWDKGRGG